MRGRRRPAASRAPRRRRPSATARRSPILRATASVRSRSVIASEAKQSRGGLAPLWIAASPPAPRNDGFFHMLGYREAVADEDRTALFRKKEGAESRRKIGRAHV